MNLADIAPRLALARDQWDAECKRAHARRLRREARLLHLEWLVAHRELQLLRAGATGRRAYIAARQRKLDAAVRARKRAIQPTS